MDMVVFVIDGKAVTRLVFLGTALYLYYKYVKGGADELR